MIMFLIYTFDESFILSLIGGNAEASCAAQILTARAVADDMGEGLASRKGIGQWASCHLQNSERDVNQILKRQKSQLTLPIKTLQCEGEKVPWISPESWLVFLVKNGLWPMLAGCDLHDYDGARRNWSQFWENYRLIHPDFDLFEKGVDYSRTAAFLLHGDEGRTLKKHGFMVTSMQSMLGRGFDEKRVGGESVGPQRLQVNFSGHSFTTRCVLNTMPKTVYEFTPGVFHSMVDHVASSLNRCLAEGFVDDSRGGRFRIVILGVKGDAPYLAKIGGFYRSYNTTAKRGEERGPPKGVCAYCLAGQHGFPAEELGTTSPKWLPTVGVKLPWVKTPAVIYRLPHDRGHPASFLKTDIWHVVHLGFGRSWVSSIVQLVLPQLQCANLEEKWGYLTSNYLDWCASNRRQAHISKITPYLMSYGDTSGAMGCWYKGALTSNLMMWCVYLLGKVRPDARGLLVQCRAATHRLNSMFKLLYSAGVFLSKEQAIFVSTQGLAFLRCYASMARAMFNDNCQWLFPLYPKLHIFHHLMLDVKFTAERVSMCVSPMAYACQMDEDTVGKASRLSRRVNIRKVSQRVLERYLTAAYAAFSKVGLLS